MNRRGFLKAAAGIASLPLVGKMASSVKSPMVREGIANVANVVSDAPVYFWKLVDKIRNLGKDVTETASTLDTQKVKQYKDYELTEDLTTGQIEIQRLGRQSDDAYVNEQASEDVFMTYRPSEKILLDEANPAGGVRKTMPEYEEFTAYTSNNRGNTGEILEEVSGVPDDILKEVEAGSGNVPESFYTGPNAIKKANGGIINLAGGGRVNLRTGGIPKALQAALKTIKSKFGDDAIKNVEQSSELNDYRFEASPEFNIKRPESAIIRDKMKNFGKPGQYNPDGSIDYDYYAQILNDEENIFVSGLESIDELELMKKERFAYYDDMRGMYDRGELDKYSPSKFDNVNDNQIAEAVENIFPTGDIKLDAEMAAESLVELNPQIFGDILYEDLDSVTRSKIYGAVLEVISGNTAKMIQQSKNLSSPTKTLASMKAGKGIDISDPNIADEFTRFMKESDPGGYKDIEEKILLESFDPKKTKGNADGGIIGLTSNPRSASNKAGVETLFKRR